LDRGHRVQRGGRQRATHGGGGRQLEKGRTEVIEYRETAARQRLMEEVAASWRKVRQQFIQYREAAASLRKALPYILFL
jgi:hypothetical protein